MSAQVKERLSRKTNEELNGLLRTSDVVSGKIMQGIENRSEKEFGYTISEDYYSQLDRFCVVWDVERQIADEISSRKPKRQGFGQRAKSFVARFMQGRIVA